MAGKKVISPKWAQFAIEYVQSGNATDAYLLAGYACSTRKDAQSAASQLLNNPTVVTLVDKERKRVQRKLEISSEKVFREIAALAFSDVRELFNEDGTLKDPHEWEDHVAAAVASIEVFEEYQGEGKGKAKKYIGRTKKVRLWDKVSSLEKLARLLGMNFRESTPDQSVNVNVLVGPERADEEFIERVRLLAERVRARQLIAGGAGGVQAVEGSMPSPTVVDTLPGQAPGDGISQSGG